MHVKIALIIFYSGLSLDAVFRMLGKPIEGIYYGFGSYYRGITRVPENNLTEQVVNQPLSMVLTSLALFYGCFWFMGKELGVKIAMGILSLGIFQVLIISPLLVSDLYDLAINKFWILSMLYCALVFLANAISLFLKFNKRY